MTEVSVNEQAEKFVARARTQVMLDPRLIFFAALTLHLPARAAAEETATMGTDGREIVYNPSWVVDIVAEDKDVLQGVIVHEVMHAALCHIWRRVNRDARTWNFATDYAINLLITPAGLRLPKGALLNSEYTGMAAEEIYRVLFEEAKAGADSGDGAQEDSTANGKTPGGEQQTWGDHSRWGDSDGDQEQAERLAGDWRLKLAAAAQEAQRQGHLPADVARAVGVALRPKVDWRAALAAFVQPTRADYSFTPPDRRFLCDDIILPDMNNEGVEDVVFAVDTSGSIDEELLSQFTAEIRAVMQTWPQMRAHLCACDAAVHGWREICGEENGLQVQGDFFRGGGGTDFRPVFDEARKKHLCPVALVYLTDGCGTYPDAPPEYPVLWVLGGTHRQPPPWGVVVEVD